MDDRSTGLPEPEQIVDLPHFVTALGQLRLWAGAPSYRSLAKAVGPLMRPPQVVAHTTVTDMFKPGRRRLDVDLVAAVLRALGLDEPTATRWLAACVRVHSEAKTGGSAGALRQLPPDLPTFVGREREIAQVLAATFGTADPAGNADGVGAADSPTVVISAIEGMAGVGKTQLAVHAAHLMVRAGRYADVQLYVNLRGHDPEHPPADPAAVLDAFLRHLDVPAQQIPEDLDGRAAMFRDRLTGRQALLLLDNAADEEQVRPLVPAEPGCLVLVTSRRTLAGLDGAVLHQLAPMTPEESLALLAGIAGAERVEAEPGAAARLVETCGHLPLAVALLASRLRTRPNWKISHLLERLTEAGLDAIAVGRRTLKPIFDLSYDGLPAEAQHLFQALGLFHGTDITARTAATLAGTSTVAAQALLELLQDEHMLQQPAPGRYTMHDLIRAYAAERAALLPAPERRAALARTVAWYALSTDAAVAVVAPHRSQVPVWEGRDLAEPGIPTDRFERHDEALAWLTEERQNLAAALEHAQQLDSPFLVETLALLLTDFLAIQDYWEDYLAAEEVRVANAARQGDTLTQAQALNGMARALMEKERYVEALRAGHAAMELHADIGTVRMRAATTETVALVHYFQEEYQQSLDWFLKALALRREDDYAFGLAATLNNLANVYVELGMADAAMAAQQEAISTAEAADLPYAVGLLKSAHGQSLRDLGRLDDSAAWLRESIAVFEGLGDHRNHATTLDHLAGVLDRAGRPEEAAESRRLAEELRRRADAV
ncbi:ATP-binding protein [Streptacidiphilus monticola]|uniref:ATP-binding protein n=1 Tax=Streptacidiphilus monticola TaxID=2161674 RepID=A0ABW1G1N8_9ACTN